MDPASLTITANSLTKTYGQTVTFAGTEFTSTGLQNGETIGSVSLASPGTAATANVSGSPYTITASNASGGTFNPSNYAISYNPGALTVDPAALTITANSLTKTYGQTVTFAGTEFTSIGLQNGESIGSVSLASAGTSGPANVSGSPYAISAANATGGTFNPSNYAITYDPGTLTIDPATVTITANSLTKTYGQTINFAGNEFTSTGLQNGETVGSVSLASPGTPSSANVAGSPYTITVGGAVGGTFNPANYSITYVPGLLTVDPAGLTLTVTADNESKTYGQTFQFTGDEFTSTGLAGGDTIGSVTLASAGAPASANVGSYPIVASNAAGGTFNPSNYAITYVAGTLTVDPALLTPGLTGTISKTYDGTTAATLAAGNYTLAGVISGDNVTLNDPTTGNYISKDVGTGIQVSVSGLQLGGAQAGNYTLASTAASGNIGTITPATLLYVADPATISFGAGIPVLGGSVSGFVGGDTLASATTGTLVFTTPAISGSAPGLYAIDGSGLTATDYTIVQAGSNARALTIGEPVEVTSRPIVVGGTSIPSLVLGGGAAPGTVGATPGPAQTDSAAGAPLSSVVTDLVLPNGQTSAGAVAVNAALPPGSGQVETSVAMGGFTVVYQTDYSDGRETGDGLGGGLDYASSFTTFDSREHPTSKVRHSNG